MMIVAQLMMSDIPSSPTALHSRRGVRKKEKGVRWRSNRRRRRQDEMGGKFEEAFALQHRDVSRRKRMRRERR